MAEQGLGDMVAPPPVLGVDALAAVHCWRWCGGWAPERWGAYGALHPVDDWTLLMELLQIMKDRL